MCRQTRGKTIIVGVLLIVGLAWGIQQFLSLENTAARSNFWMIEKADVPEEKKFVLAIAALSTPTFPLTLTTRTLATKALPQIRTYVGFALRDILTTLPELPHLNTARYEVIFSCADGWQDSIALTEALAGDGFLALGEGQRGHWSPIVDNPQATPGPAYFVADPWPYQVTRLIVAPSAVFFGAAYPENSAAVAGFRKFKTHCMTCHAVNGVGGIKGPPLVANGSTALSRYELKNLPDRILNAEAYWPNTQMRPFQAENLTRGDVEKILGYLLTKASEKKSD